MCNLCNGTHVVHELDSIYTGFYTCPVCGPEPEEAFQARMAELREKIALAKLSLIEKGA